MKIISYIKNKSIHTNLSLVSKICLAGLFIALATICQKVLAINYISAIPFVRISFGGCALIMFSSFLLGPWFGLLVGAASDVLGYFIFDPKAYGFFPQITAIYCLLGFFSYFVFSFIRFINKKKTMLIIEYSTLSICLIFAIIFLCLNSELTLYSKTYQINTTMRIVIPICMFAFICLLAVLNFLFDRKFKRFQSSPINIYQISFSCLLLEVFVMILFGSLMKACAFGFQTYTVILISQIIVGFINVPMNTFILMYIIYLTRKYIR